MDIATPTLRDDRALAPRVLCIDDDPAISEAIAVRMSNFDAEFLRAYHGMQGYWLAATEHPDVIVTDIQMPQGNGDYIVECLKQNNETRNIPVIVLTGRSDKALEKRMIMMGAECFLQKPAAVADVIRVISEYVYLQSTNDEYLDSD